MEAHDYHQMRVEWCRKRLVILRHALDDAKARGEDKRVARIGAAIEDTEWSLNMNMGKLEKEKTTA